MADIYYDSDKGILFFPLPQEVALDGTVEHVFAARHAPVAQHHVLRPHAVGLLWLDAMVVDAAAREIVGVVAFVTWDGHVVSIVLEYGHVGEILHDVVGPLRRYVLVCQRAALHANVILHADEVLMVAVVSFFAMQTY